jgi:hypothetical protein
MKALRISEQLIIFLGLAIIAAAELIVYISGRAGFVRRLAKPSNRNELTRTDS